MIKFDRPAPPGRGSAAGRKFLAPPYYSQRAVFASPLSAFFIITTFLSRHRGSSATSVSIHAAFPLNTRGPAHAVSSNYLSSSVSSVDLVKPWDVRRCSVGRLVSPVVGEVRQRLPVLRAGEGVWRETRLPRPVRRVELPLYVLTLHCLLKRSS